MADMVRV